MTTVVQFPRLAPQASYGWQNEEFQQIVAACSRSVSIGEASEWEIGTTEYGDPQVYLIGPAPNYDCILCISRIGRHYVIEDGQGRVLLQDDSPMLFAERAIGALRRRKELLLVKVAIVWHAFREAFEEKVLTREPLEALMHIAPQLAVLA